jgi:hypothetical protein
MSGPARASRAKHNAGHDYSAHTLALVLALLFALTPTPAAAVDCPSGVITLTGAGEDFPQDCDRIVGTRI